jgi:DNA invertase Pin-like site-specific DNA recombinase
MKKVIALTRVSTLSQELESQQQKVLDAIKQDGYEENEVIMISNKESGVLLSEEEMLGLDRLKEEISNPANQIEAVYVFELSRIARQGTILYSIRDFLIAHKVQLICLNPYFKMFKKDGTFDEHSNVFFGIYVGMAESEGFIRKVRLKRGKEKAKAEGRFTGGKVLFGYTLDKDNHFIIHEENAELVRRIYKMYVSGQYSARQISTLLYKEGMINQVSERTRETFVGKILKNPAYWNETTYPDAIISKKDWEKAQELLSQYQIKPRRTYEENIYFGHKLLFVEESNRQMMIRKADGAYVEPVSKYHVNINVVDSLLLHCAEYSSQFHRQADWEEIKQKYEEDMKSLQLRLENYKTKEKEIRASIDRIEERLIIGKLSPEKAGLLEEKFERELKELTISRQKDIELRSSLEKNLEAMQGEYDDTRNIYELSEQEQADRVKQEIEKVWVGREKNSHYILRVRFKNPLIDGQIYEVYTKKHLITLYGKPIEIKILNRIQRRKR